MASAGTGRPEPGGTVALKVVLNDEDIEGLDEALRGHYTQSRDGSWHLDAEGIDEHPTVQGLKRTLKKFRDVEPNADRLAARMQEAERLRETLGEMEPDDIQAKLQRLEELEQAGGDATAIQEKLEAQKAALEKRYGKEVETREQALASRDGFIRKLLIENALDQALAKAEVIEAYRPAVKALMKERGPRVIQEGEEYRAVFDTELGEADVMTYVEKWAREDDEAKHYLPASGNQGTGAGSGRGGTGGNASNPYKKGDTFNMTEQARLERENPALAKQLAAAAGVRLQTA
jgi:hypothetical protein